MTQFNGFGDGQPNLAGGGFANGFSSGGVGGFTSSSSSTGGRSFNPTLGLAFDIEPIRDQVKRSGKKSGSATAVIVEIGQTSLQRVKMARNSNIRLTIR